MTEQILSSSVLILVIMALRYASKGKISSRLRYGLWALVLIRLLIPVGLWDSPVSVANVLPEIGRSAPYQTGITTIPRINVSEAGPRPETLEDNPQLPPEGSSHDPSPTTTSPGTPIDWARICWFAGTGVVGLGLLGCNLHFAKKMKRARRLIPAPNCPLDVYETDAVATPCMFGLLHPAIYVTPEISGNDEMMGHVLEHEITHWRHKDHVWSLFRAICLALHWYNPLVWLAAQMSMEDAELACDEGTIARIGEDVRMEYGRTLIGLASGGWGKGALLTVATTMNGGKRTIKERISLLSKKPRTTAFALVAMLLVAAVAAGCTFSRATRNGDKDLDIYERSGTKIAIPKEYSGDLLVDPVAIDDESILLGVYQKSSYEEYPGMGRLFHIARYPEAQYEQFLTQDGSGMSFFAKDSKGNYYGFFVATDMVVAPGGDYEQFTDLLATVGDFVRSDMITRNGLTSYGDREFFSKTYTYEGDHVILAYRPYQDSPGPVWTVVLSQPLTQGQGGIWCVERWRDEYGNVYPYFPDKDGTPSSVYYRELQASCDSGDDTYLLDPKEVAALFAREVLQHSWATTQDFSEADAPFSPEDLFSRSTGNIHDYMPAIVARETVSDYDLLPCFSTFTRATWLELESIYGGPDKDWFNPFWEAVRMAAIGDASDQLFRDYYVGLAFLTSDGAFSESLQDIMAGQWIHDPLTYNTCLQDRFSPQEEETLRNHISYSLIWMDDGIFTLTAPTNRGIYLGSSPIGFPFGLDLVETRRDTGRVESFGQRTIVWCDGLQVTYFHNYQGIYGVTKARTTKEHYAVGEGSIGATEEHLLSNWTTPLTKIESISYEDEEWFGDIYDYAYAYSQRTKSVLFLVRAGEVVGIELVDGLDGSMYPGAVPN